MTHPLTNALAMRIRAAEYVALVAAERIWAFLFGSNESSTLKGEHA